jgi:hypothetical protein
VLLDCCSGAMNEDSDKHTSTGTGSPPTRISSSGTRHLRLSEPVSPLKFPANPSVWETDKGQFWTDACGIVFVARGGRLFEIIDGGALLAVPCNDERYFIVRDKHLFDLSTSGRAIQIADCGGILSDTRFSQTTGSHFRDLERSSRRHGCSSTFCKSSRLRRVSDGSFRFSEETPTREIQATFFSNQLCAIPTAQVPLQGKQGENPVLVPVDSCVVPTAEAFVRARFSPSIL